MLTPNERAVYEQTGLVPPDRLRSLAYALRQLANDARVKSVTYPKDDPQAIALRGKATAYAEAARMADHIRDGYALRPRKYSSTRRRAREWAERRAARRASGQ